MKYIKFVSHVSQSEEKANGGAEIRLFVLYELKRTCVTATMITESKYLTTMEDS